MIKNCIIKPLHIIWYPYNNNENAKFIYHIANVGGDPGYVKGLGNSWLGADCTTVGPAEEQLA
jgi:hypothetical protein